MLSPAVRRMLTEHGLKASQIPGTGKDGRLTAQDITRFVETRSTARPALPDPAVRRAQESPPETRSARPLDAPPRPARESAAESPVGRAFASRQVPHSAIRRRIAAHMVASVSAAPHVTTLFEADMTRVSAHRARHAAAFEARGAKLTYTAYLVAAAVKGLQAVPEVNSSFHADTLEIFSDCNVGVGTALGNEGLIVPVIHRAQTLDLFGIAARLNELVTAARDGKLSPDAVRGGTVHDFESWRERQSSRGAHRDQPAANRHHGRRQDRATSHRAASRRRRQYQRSTDVLPHAQHRSSRTRWVPGERVPECGGQYASHMAGELSQNGVRHVHAGSRFTR